MTKDTVSDELMVRYLLGDVSDEDRVGLEERYFVDDRVFDQLSALEDELVDDYVRGELSEPQRKLFELHFLNSAQRREKLAFAESFIQYFSNSTSVSARANSETWLQSLTGWLGLRGTTARWAFAAVCAAVVVGGAWLVRENWWLRSQLRDLQAQQTGLRQREEQLATQLAQLKVLGSEGTPAREVAQSQFPSLPTLALTLTAGILRSTAAQNTITIPPGAYIIQLRLYLEDQSYESYLATLETAEGGKVWSEEGFRTTSEGKTRMVVLELPSGLLVSKDYIVELSGVRGGADQANQPATKAPHTVTEEIATYSFRVVKH